MCSCFLFAAELLTLATVFCCPQHAAHVMLSIGKMMKRIVEPEDIEYDIDFVDARKRTIEIARQVHESTYGISSDALLQFTSVFAALIHDADHTGLTNKELIELKVPLATQYRETSVAEQVRNRGSGRAALERLS